MTFVVKFDSTFEFPVFELIYLPNFSLNGKHILKKMRNDYSCNLIIYYFILYFSKLGVVS